MAVSEHHGQPPKILDFFLAVSRSSAPWDNWRVFGVGCCAMKAHDCSIVTARNGKARLFKPG
jgi:hypothetical protein